MNTRDASLTDVVGQFFRWWRRELAWFVPNFLRDRGPASSRLLWLDVSVTPAVVRHFIRGKLTDLGSVDMEEGDPEPNRALFAKLHNQCGAPPVGICVGSDQVLRRQVSLPLAAREDLASAMRFQMDIHTPFRADEVFYIYSETAIQAGNVILDLSVMPKQVVVPGLKRLQEWGFSPQAIALVEQLDGKQGFENYLPVSLRPATPRVWRWLYLAMAITSVVLAAAWLALPIWQKRNQAMDLIPKVAKAEREAKSVAALKDRANVALAWHNHLVVKRTSTPSTVLVLDEITRLMPDHTWLESLEIRGNEVTLQGESGSASGLVNLFPRAPLFGEASHKAPLVKSYDNRERFRLSLALQTSQGSGVEATTSARSAGESLGAGQSGMPKDKARP